MLNAIIAKAQKLILSPKAGWDMVDAETTDMMTLYKTWIAPLAAIPVLAAFIGTVFIGVPTFSGGVIRYSVATGIGQAVITYVLALGWVYVFAMIVDFLAPNFGAEKNFDKAFKVSAHFPVAGWLAGIFAIIPMASFLSILGLYSLYLLFVGLPRIMAPAEDKKTVYVLACIGVAIVLGIVVYGVLYAVTPKPGFGL